MNNELKEELAKCQKAISDATVELFEAWNEYEKRRAKAMSILNIAQSKLSAIVAVRSKW